MRRHRHRLTLISAFLAVFTFFAKDAWRDGIKDFADVFEKAENTYLIRSDISELRPEIQEVRNYLELLMGVRQQPYVYDAGLEQSRRLAHLAKVRSDNDSVTFKTILQLLDKMPLRFHNESIQDVSRIRQQQTEFNSQFKEWSTVYLSGEERKARVDKSLGLASKMTESGNEISERVHALGDTVFRQADEVKAANERDYRIAAWVVYLLLAIGGIMALVGRLFGVEGIGDVAD
jgi:hypothetical protein